MVIERRWTDRRNKIFHFFVTQNGEWHHSDPDKQVVNKVESSESKNKKTTTHHFRWSTKWFAVVHFFSSDEDKMKKAVGLKSPSILRWKGKKKKSSLMTRNIKRPCQPRASHSPPLHPHRLFNLPLFLFRVVIIIISFSGSSSTSASTLYKNHRINDRRQEDTDNCYSDVEQDKKPRGPGHRPLFTLSLKIKYSLQEHRYQKGKLPQDVDCKGTSGERGVRACDYL